MDINVRKNPSSADIDLIKSGLKEFNKEFGTEDQNNSIGFIAYGNSGQPIGGALCSFQYTSCYIHLLWIAPHSRGKGVGSAVLAALIKECKDAGIRDIFLDSFSFQNTEFYEGRGFERVGCLKNYPKQGISRYFYHAVVS